MARIVPLTGTEAQRQAASTAVLPAEIHTTSDQRRVFVENQLVAPVWQGTVADQAAMLALNSTSAFGCWRGDACFRSDTNAAYQCISGNGTTAGQWRALGPLRQSAVADVDDATLPANGAIAALTFSATPTQAECQALRDECEKLRDVLANAITTIETLRDRLKTTGGCGLLAD